MKPLKDCKVLVTTTSYGNQDPQLKPYLEDRVGQVVYNPTGKPLTSGQLIEMLEGVDGWIAGLDEITGEVLSNAKSLRVISRYGVGCSNVDLDAARSRNIVVTNTPGANAKSVAELTVALMLNLMRPVIPANARTKGGEWPRFKGLSLEGKTIGLIGLGAIGKETARRLAGFDCEILAYDVVQDQHFSAEHDLGFVEIDELLSRSDIVSLHLPSTPETFEMVDEDFLAKMKPGAMLVNTSRGDLVKETALIHALETGALKGVALDVFKVEPPGKDYPLFKYDQVIATPHMGAHSDSATNAMGWNSTLDCLAVLQGKEPKYRVT